MSLPTLSIIIVNYNVRYFLEQCLQSVYKAIHEIPCEIFVVDNDSSDDSVQIVKSKHPQVILIQNDKNVGFSKANNQAIKRATGKYILLLNPDTIVKEDTFNICIDFFSNHPDAGAVGVRMIDGSGKFLPESKRGLPTPFVSFCRFSGLSNLFPKSRLFNRYYLGYLDEHNPHPVNVLSGAFFMVRKRILEKIGLLDERFFMYGEDIDLSYRIEKAGYKNFYLPTTTIVHYKGESTRKGSLNYVKTFYQAMAIFAEKHFSKQAEWYNLVIKLAIYSRALISMIARSISKLIQPVFDVLILSFMFWGVKELWEQFYHNSNSYYPPEYEKINIPVYVLVFAIGVTLSGVYNRTPFKMSIKTLSIVTLVMFIIYAMFPQELRPSRVLLVLSIALGWGYFIIRNKFAGLFKGRYRNKAKNVAVVGKPENAQKILGFLEYAGQPFNYLGYFGMNSPKQESGSYLGNLEILVDVCRTHQINEIIFCSLDIPFSDITEIMTKLGPEYHYKIASQDQQSIVGSRSKNEPGEWITQEIHYRIQDPVFESQKNILDWSISILLLLFCWIVIWFVRHPKVYFKHIFRVLSGKYSWVGYIPQDEKINSLPALKPGIFKPDSRFSDLSLRGDTTHKINILYAKDYDVWVDLGIIFGSL